MKQNFSTEVDNDVLVTNEITENTRQNGISTVAIKEDRRNYPCGQCNYQATYTSHLKKHIKSIHEGERYPCNQCSYKATEKGNLRRHQLSKHNN